MKADLQNKQDKSQIEKGRIPEYRDLRDENDTKTDLEVILTRLGLGNKLVLQVSSLLGNLISDFSYFKGSLNGVRLNFKNKNIKSASLRFISRDPRMENIYYYPNADEVYFLDFEMMINGEYYAGYTGKAKNFRLSTSTSDGLFVAYGNLEKNQMRVYYYNEKSIEKMIEEFNFGRELLPGEEKFVKNVMLHFDPTDKYIRPQSITTIKFTKTEDIIPYLMEGEWLHKSYKKELNSLKKKL